MLKFHLLALPLAFAAAGLGSGAASAAATAPKPVVCELRVAPVAGGREITAVAKAGTAIAASYELAMNAVSSGGTANTNQGDDVDLVAGETVLSTTSIGPGGKFNAKLTVTWTGGTTSCVVKG
jgi:hypothetical protein